jgi:ornithine lipid hydroxylase
MTRVLDYLLAPALLVGSLWATAWLHARNVSPFIITSIVVGLAFAIMFVLERVYAERDDWKPFDQSLVIDGSHYAFNYQLGIFLGYVASFAVPAALRWKGGWPTTWSFAWQVVLAVFLSEGVSYWSHRAAHRWQWLWRFHALHHSGASLNVIRTGRFHGVDIGIATFLTFVPLTMMGAPELIITALTVFTGVVGLITHANVRMRTPRWADYIMCTPAVHRHHHSSDLVQGNENFGTTLIIFDVIFGTHRAPPAPAPEEVGIIDDPTPRGFFAQVFAPFVSDPARHGYGTSRHDPIVERQPRNEA